MTETKSVAIYCRCSTTHQDLALQEEALREFISRRGWTLHDVYADKGVSGAKDKRPELDRLMKDARQRRFDVVAVYKFDRFGRSTAHLVNSLNEFQSLGIDFVSITEAVDSSTPAGRVLFSVIAAIAEFERSLIVERVRAGVARAKDRGVKFGRKRKGFDFQKAVEMRKAGSSFREIARALGVSHVTVYKALQGVVDAVNNVA